MTDEKRLEEIKARAEAATPGPWQNPGMAVIPLTFDRECNIYPPDTTKTHGFQFGGPVAVVNYRGEDSTHPDGSDADFIAHARTDIPWLISRLEAQQVELQRLRRERAECPWCSVDEKPVLERYKAMQTELAALRKDRERLFSGFKNCLSLLCTSLMGQSGAFANAVCEEELPQLQQLLASLEESIDASKSATAGKEGE